MMWSATRKKLDELKERHGIPQDYDGLMDELWRLEIRYSLRNRNDYERFINSACLAVTAFSVAMAPIILVVSLACFAFIPFLPFGILGLVFVMVIRGARRAGIEQASLDANTSRRLLNHRCS